jgi:TRAP-type C4-dicarboxylate transport system permease small subunit
MTSGDARARVRAILAGLEDNVAAALLALLLAVMCWQVLTRYVLGAPSEWSEEAARYLYVYVVFLGTSAGISARRHVSITYFTDMLRPGARLAVSLAVDVLILAFLAIMLWWGWRATLRNLDIPLAVTQVSYAWVYVVVPVTSFLMIVRTVLLMRSDIARYRNWQLAPEDHQQVII